MAKHAYLAASASERWLRCPPSAKLCAQEEDRGSPYAQQGTDAHELAAYLAEKALGRNSRDPTENLTWYDAEMQEAAEGYAAFVMEQVAEAKKLCADPLVCIEQTLDFSKWVEHGFGTGDCVIVADDLLHIVDLKYGVGILVSASGEDGTGNSQLKCYALGALDTFGDLYDIRRIKLSIFQPRRENVDTFEMTKEDLLKWADEVLAPIAKLAYEGLGDFAAGDHCQFCKIKANCRARAEYSMELAKYEFAEARLWMLTRLRRSCRRSTALYPGRRTSKNSLCSRRSPVSVTPGSSWSKAGATASTPTKRLWHRSYRLPDTIRMRKS